MFEEKAPVEILEEIRFQKKLSRRTIERILETPSFREIPRIRLWLETRLLPLLPDILSRVIENEETLLPQELMTSWFENRTASMDNFQRGARIEILKLIRSVIEKRE